MAATAPPTRAAQALRDLTLPPARPGSGRRRYAAAMWFHARGELSETDLEACRERAMDDAAAPPPALARLAARLRR